MSRLELAVLVPGLFVCVLATQESVSPKCGGYTLYKDAGGYLMYHEIPVTFDDAKRRCAVEGGVLASPINNGIKAAIMDILKTWNVQNVFTGFSSKPNNGGIFSSIEGTRLSNIEHTWAPGEPNNYKNNENCIVLSPHGTMSDVKCYHQYPYFCFLRERRAKYVVCGVNNAVFPDYALDNTTGSCYKFHSNKLVFVEAAKVCEQEGGYLAIINGDNEAQAVKNLISKYSKQYAMIGFRFFNNPGMWMTIEGESIEDAGYAKWNPDEGQDSAPDMSVGVLMNNGLFNFFKDYSATVPFICEKEPEIVFCENKWNDIFSSFHI